MNESQKILIRHEGHTPRERSECGWRDRLISREDAALEPAAWAHAVDIRWGKAALSRSRDRTLLRFGRIRSRDTGWSRARSLERFIGSYSAGRSAQRHRQDACSCDWHTGHR
jgi:hypothetical protein